MLKRCYLRKLTRDTSEVSGKETQHDEKSGTCEGINWGSSIQENNLKIPHVPARASTHARRVLPS